LAKNVFRPNEIINVNRKVRLESPREQEPEVMVIEEITEYTGPTADDLRREAQIFQENWEKEKSRMLTEAKAEADKIIQEAEQTAFEEVKKRNEEARDIKKNTDQEVSFILEGAKKSAEEIEAEAKLKAEEIIQEARSQGLSSGREEGFAEGREEVERLIERLHLIIDKAIERRSEIIDESETELVKLSLQVAHKVVKVITENQQNVVVNNMVQALRKLKSKADVVIRVNLADLQLTTDHTREILEKIEKVGKITIMEDSSVDRGGCIIETDFGQIDARISSQLKEIEDRILEMVPIRTKNP
jgi:flagellar assembly protein FliH